MLSIIQAAGWPIWPLIACSVLGLALIFERFLALKTARVAPPKLLDEAITVSSKAVPTPDVVNQLAQNSALGEVLASGLRLSPRELPLLASLGIATVTVRRPLKVAIFSTGDELKPLGTPLAHGDIYDSNRYGVKAMLTRMGIACLDLGIIPDDPAALRAAFIQADCEADALITTGGVSVGEADFTKQLLEELGEIGFWKLAIKPGKPFAFGKLNHSWFCGLPGNSVSAALTFYQLVQPLLASSH